MFLIILLFLCSSFSFSSALSHRFLIFSIILLILFKPTLFFTITQRIAILLTIAYDFFWSLLCGWDEPIYFWPYFTFLPFSFVVFSTLLNHAQI